MLKIKKKFIANLVSFKAGWIASRCPSCIIDDKAEEIHPCPEHETKIGELYQIAQANW